ncbi:MAG: hypothetical protein QFC55_07385 [Chloroflexota bacterium]|nr:hypothetical protein [Chloroflexota bacterium]
MYARRVTIKGDPTLLDDVVRTQRDVVLPALHACAGFVAQLVLLDRAAGEVIGMSIWDNEENMYASEAKIQPARQQVAEVLRAFAAPEVRIYELAIFDRP